MTLDEQGDVYLQSIFKDTPTACPIEVGMSVWVSSNKKRYLGRVLAVEWVEERLDHIAQVMFVGGASVWFSVERLTPCTIPRQRMKNAFKLLNPKV